MLVRFFLIAGIFFFAFTSNAQDKSVPKMNVLFIGNSYTHMHNMPGIFEKIAKSKGVKLDVTMDAKSNHTFKMHSKRSELFKTIKSKRWDYVVLQGFSRELSESPGHIDTASVPYIGILLDSIYANNSCSNVLLYMTWGYKNGFAEREEVNTNESMSDSIRVGYEYVSELFDIPMVPVGPVWSDFRKSNTKIDLYHNDLAHPSIFGSYLIACSFYSAIFKKIPLDAYRGKINKRVAKQLQESSYKYIINNLDTFKLKQNTLSVKCEVNRKGQYLTYCTADYPNARSVTWNFDDGTTSNKRKVTHEFKEAGEYSITLIIEDLCGTRKIIRKVKFNAPKRPSRKKKSKAKVVQDTNKKV